LILIFSAVADILKKTREEEMRRRASQPEAALFTPNQTKLENRFSSNQSEDSVTQDRPTGFVSQVSQVRRIYFSLKPMVCFSNNAHPQ